LWLATPNHLVRFDGDQFEEFEQKEFAFNYKQRITLVVGGRDGTLWLPLDHGPVVRLGHGTVQSISNDVPDLVVETAIEDDEGDLWTSYRGGRLCRIRDGKVLNFSAKENFPENSGGCYLAKDNHGHVWIAKTGQVAIYRNGRFETVLPAQSAATRLTGARDNGMWMCSGRDFFKCDENGNLKKLGSLESEQPGSIVTTLIEDRGGAVWIGSSAGGLYRYDGSRIETIPTSYRDILSLLEDSQGNIWAGTAGGGLNRIQPRTIDLEDTDSGLPFEAVQSLCQDTQGTIWAVTQNGVLLKRRNGAWNTVTNNPGLHDEFVECVAADDDGGIWIGGRARIHHWHGGKFETWSTAEGLSSRIIHALLFSKGALWIGGSELEKMQNGRLKSIPLPPQARLVRAMAEDNTGNVWLGTANGFLMRMTNDEVCDETARVLGAPDSIRCLTATPDGSLWIGFATEGLGRWKGGKFFRCRAAQGLGDDTVSQILVDGRGWMWIGTDHGIFKIRQQELEAMADGKIARVQAIHCGRDEGLYSLQANFGFTPEALRTRDGELWMPMASGLACISPTRLPDRAETPPVLLKRVEMDERAIAVYGGVIPVGNVLDLDRPRTGPALPAGRHRLEFEFTALDFTSPENLQFRYQLKDVDKDWIDGKSRRDASYPGLAAGHYQFQVTARKQGGTWNSSVATFEFSIRPYFWETWWFRLAAMAVFTACVIATGRYVSLRRLQSRVQQLEQQAALEKERARIAKDIHDDLGGSLTHAALLLDLAVRDGNAPAKSEAHVRQAASAIRQVTEAVDEIVWAANPRNDTLADLNDYISLFAIQFLQAANIRCRMDCPRNFPHRTLSPEVRHSLFLLAKEALNNVVHHAHASEVRLQIVVTEEFLKINIRDNGNGFTEAAGRNGHSDGLRNMKQRMMELGGQFFVESKPKEGTTISAVYFWPQPK
jgi:signal transduction histidine kinase/ligand-binding sensor domain-containing protein